MLKLVCEEHELEFNYYCQECECLICTHCVTSVHKGHSFTDIAEVAATARGDVRNRLVQIKDNIKNLSDLIEDFKTTKQTKLQTGNANFTKEVTEMSQGLVRIIETETLTNLTDASKFLVQEKQQLLYNLAELEKSYSKYYSIHEKSEQILREKHDVSFFLKNNSLAKEFKLLGDIPSFAEPKDIDPFKQGSFVDYVINQIESKYNMRKQSLQYEAHVLEQKLKEEREDAICNVNKLRNEKEIIIDTFTQQLKRKDNDIQRLHGEIRQMSEDMEHYEQFSRQTQEELQSLKAELKRKTNALQELSNKEMKKEH